jgi:hypothetical protein
MAQLFKNNGWSTLNGGLTDSQTTLQVLPGTGGRFPEPAGGDYFHLTVADTSGGTESSWEIVKVTARTGDSMTVQRGQEGTAARVWVAGVPVELRVTAEAPTRFEAHGSNTLNPHGVTKTQVGLSNVDNTSDASKPVSTAQQTALNLKLDANHASVTNSREWTAGTVAQADAEAGTATTRTAWTAQRVRQAIAAWWTGSADKTKLDGISPGAQVNAVTSVATKTGAVTLVKADVGLGNVDDTSDASKPVSTAQQTALNLKLDANHASVTNSREWTADTVTQAEAETGTATDRRVWTAQRVRQAVAAWWIGSTDKTKLDGISPGAQVNAVTSVATKTGAVTLVKADVGLGNVDNTSDASKPVSTAQQTALNLKSDTTHTHGAATTSVAGFMSASDKSKLDGVATSANDYSHPANHPPSIITQDTNNRFVTDAEKTAWNAKQAALVSGTNIKTVNNTSLLGAGNIEIEGGVTLSTEQTLSNKTLAGVKSTGFVEEARTTANTGTAYTVGSATFYDLTLTGNCGLTFPAAVAGRQFTLLLTQDATGGRTVTWPASVKWAGEAPALSEETDAFSFLSDGTVWLGFVGGIGFERGA